MNNEAALTGDWLVRLDRSRVPLRKLVCFPHAGGSASAFRSWLPELSSDMELHAIQLPGRQKRILEPPLRELHETVEKLLGAITPILGPNTTFFGDCTGALIAYETLNAARAAGLPVPGRLIISCCRAPNLQCRHVLLHRLSDEDLIAQIRRLSFAPEWLLNDATALRSFLPLLRCDFELAETYTHRPSEPLSIPVTAIAGLHDTITPECDVHAWQSFTSARFEYVSLDGHHNLALTQAREILRIVQATDAGS